VQLHRTADAFDALFTHFAAPELEAQRLALLVQIHAQQSDPAAITRDLLELETQYVSSPAHATALAAAGNYYYRQLNWQEAARAYQRLSELFPQSESAREDGWRLTWCQYLLHDSKAAEAMKAYLRRFPDSSHTPAGFYWLGRMEEEQGAPSEARELYGLLGERFAHSYYTVQVARSAALHRGQGSAPGTTGSAPDSLAAMLAQVVAPPANPPGLGCLASTPGDTARTALILGALSLKDLEEEYLKRAIAAGSAPDELRLLHARLLAAQKSTSEAMFDAIKIEPAYPQLDFSKLPKELWNLIYPQAFWTLIQRQARARGLDPYLVMGLVRQESGFNPKALSVADARGLMQILPETAAPSRRASSLRAARRRLFDPAYNVRTGCAYLQGLMKMFDNRPELALAAYHAGDFRVRDWLSKATFPDSVTFLESIPIQATRIYVEAVLRDAEVYRQLMTKSPHFAVCADAQARAQ
jgi:soluble lytic murein transglycosylase